MDREQDSTYFHNRLTIDAGGTQAWIADADLQFTFARSGGPGGQAVNKISSKAILRVRLSAIRGLDEHATARLRKAAGSRLTHGDELLIASEIHRSQQRNKQECLDRLTQIVAGAMIKPKPRKKKKPTRSMIEKRLESKRRSSQKKNQRRQRRAPRDLD